MKKILEPQKEIDILEEAELVVVGDGPAGIGRALASGRDGVRSVLIDRFGSLGRL